MSITIQRDVIEVAVTIQRDANIVELQPILKVGGGASGAVDSIIAGTNVTISPVSGVGNVTVNASGGTGIVETIVAGTNVTVDATDPANPIVSAPTVIPKEEQISGTRLDNSNVSGNQPLDWNAYKVFNFLLTGSTTFSDLNKPTGFQTKVIELLVTGDFTLSFPLGYKGLPSNDAYDGSQYNHIVVSCISGDSDFFIFSLTNIPL